MKARRPRWFWIAAIWFAVALFDATQTVFTMHAQGMHHRWVQLFFTLLLSWLPWALATPVVVRLARRYPPQQLRPLRSWPIHISTCIAMCVITGAWVAWLEVLLNPWAQSPSGSFLDLWLYKSSNGMLPAAILYISIIAFSYVLESGERLAHQKTEAARLSAQLSQAQLAALRRQIEPHFLFNALNAIAGLVREGRTDAAVSMIARLSDFLRRVAQDSDRQRVPLREEVEYLQQYLDIQKARFADRLQLSIDVPEELFPLEVPSLMLQPIVENAIKHGIGKRAQGGAIRISAFRSNGMLTLRVYNDGPSLPPDWETNQPGVGVPNLRTRLQSLYGDEFRFSMRNQDSGGVEAAVSVPVHEE